MQTKGVLYKDTQIDFRNKLVKLIVAACGDDITPATRRRSSNPLQLQRGDIFRTKSQTLAKKAESADLVLSVLQH